MIERLPKLDDRLFALAKAVRSGARCADIGCDHGFLITWLLASGKSPAGYACDVNRKPLEKAAFTLSEYGVTSRAKLILCDGLSGLVKGDADDFILAGMGGDLIWRIIDGQPWTRDRSLRFLLQPMTKPQNLRRLLCRNGFDLLSEQAVISGAFAYSVMTAAYTGNAREVEPVFAWCGLLLDAPGEAAKQYRAKTVRLLREKEAGLQKSAHGGDALKELRVLLQTIESRDVS